MPEAVHPLKETSLTLYNNL